MASHRLWTVALAGLLTAGLARAGAPPVAPAPRGDDDRRVAARIDHHIDAELARAGLRPAPLADDATFLRRLSLDVVGRIPHVSEARRFLADKDSDKRARLVADLLDTPGYASHFTNVYRDLLLPEANSDFQRRYLVLSMERWLRTQFAANAPYDQMVRELLTLPVATKQDNSFYRMIYNGTGKPTPISFYLAKEGKAEELAASVSRLFLGVRIECAQCHDHPFGKWTRDEFWGQAAFYAGIRRPQGQFFLSPLSEVSDKRELAIPKTERVAQARFLDGREPRWKYKVSARETLAEWMTASDNPFFAKAMVNRMWAHFFGIGLVNPIDDMSDQHVPSHPELLDELAKEFVDHKFDLKFLIRAITLSNAYQRASTGTPDGNPHLFARMPVKGLTADQLYDSLLIATGNKETGNRQQRIFGFGSPRQNFMETFAAQEKPTEYQTSIPQALTLMNNDMITLATNPDRGEVLGAVVSSSFMSTQSKIETLFLAALARKPRPDELDRYLRYVEKGGATGNEKKALSDVYWALLNSTEFLFNH